MLQKCSLWKVASVFFDKPDNYFELIKISKEIRLAHTSVKNHLETLIKMNIIKRENILGIKKNYYVANRDNFNFINYKKIYNLDILNKSGLIKYISDKFMPSCIILFGSFSRGEDINSSDIDIFIECSEKNVDLTKYEKILNRRIELHFKKNFKSYSSELKNNILNGLTLYGFLEGYDA